MILIQVIYLLFIDSYESAEVIWKVWKVVRMHILLSLFSPKLLLARAFKLIEQREKLREKFSNDPNMVRPAICTSDKDKEFADRLQVVMEQQIGNAQFTIDEFASMMGLGRTVFIVRYVG